MPVQRDIHRQRRKTGSGTSGIARHSLLHRFSRSIEKQRIILVVVLVLIGTAAALAQTEDGRQACMNDAFQFCNDAIPDRERVFQCLVSHKDVISAACHAVMAPSLPVDQLPLKRKAHRAKSTKGKAAFAKRAAKALSRHGRHPLNLLPR